MTQVDFYVLKSEPTAQSERFLCLLTEKAFKKGHKIHIHTADNLQTERIDKLLWTYNEQSFLPHSLMEGELHEDSPIHISHDTGSTLIKDVLINLSAEVPDYFQGFDRVAEIVSSDPAQRQAARSRYRQYQQKGCTVTTHEVNR